MGNSRAGAAKALIDLGRVNKSFAGVTAVCGASLRVFQGEFVVILGPSGCGKTTLVRLIAGLEEPDSGAIHCDFRQTALVFQSLALFPHMTVRENVAFGPLMRGKSRAEAGAIVERQLALVQLREVADRNVLSLSGGQQQRVAIARALANSPAVVLMDEPLKSLDAGLQWQLQDDLLNLHAQTGMTFVFVTHDQREAFRLATRIVIMNHGRIIQDASPEEVFRRPRDAFVARFTGWRNVLPLPPGAPRDKLDAMLDTLSRSSQSGTAEDCLCLRPEGVAVLPASSAAAITGTLLSIGREFPAAECRVSVGCVTLVGMCDRDLASRLSVGDAVSLSVRSGEIVPMAAPVEECA